MSQRNGADGLLLWGVVLVAGVLVTFSIVIDVSQLLGLNLGAGSELLFNLVACWVLVFLFRAWTGLGLRVLWPFGLGLCWLAFMPALEVWLSEEHFNLVSSWLGKCGGAVLLTGIGMWINSF